MIEKDSKLFNGGGYYECPSCHSRVAREHIQEIVHTWAYCPYCGEKINDKKEAS